VFWQEVRERFANQWVRLEVMKAHISEGNRYIDEVVVVDRFDDSTAAMHQYSELRKQDPHLLFSWTETGIGKIGVYIDGGFSN